MTKPQNKAHAQLLDMEYLDVPTEKKDTRVSETSDEYVLRQSFGTVRSSMALV